jgi:hypothetical protein
MTGFPTFKLDALPIWETTVVLDVTPPETSEEAIPDEAKMGVSVFGDPTTNREAIPLDVTARPLIVACPTINDDCPPIEDETFGMVVVEPTTLCDDTPTKEFCVNGTDGCTAPMLTYPRLMPEDVPG